MTPGFALRDEVPTSMLQSRSERRGALRMSGIARSLLSSLVLPGCEMLARRFELFGESNMLTARELRCGSLAIRKLERRPFRG
jgi:hypothetical protein